ncbi:hypothetical protein KUV56_15685 [Ferrimonas balearica]|uniref:BRCT domain-containing protein n=1 Tax=Ferrimonas balearica TaxID=44012 RepID=UPI001C591406|nr:BRCT domain-containing protein [Ferrimonas balearica]MBW3140936.1 hypothetical protein [Ferrimonas balearica]
MSYESLCHYDLPLDGEVIEDADILTYKLKDNHPEWAALGHRYPNLTHYCLSDREDSACRPPEPEMYKHFPKLTHLSLGQLPLTSDDIDPASMAKITSIDGVVVRDADTFAKLTALPALTELKLRFHGHEADLCAAEGSQLKSLSIEISAAERLSIDLTHARQLQKCHLSDFNYFGRREGVDMALGPVQMPRSIKEFDLTTEGKVALSGPLLQAGTKAGQIRMQSRQMTLAPGALGEAAHIDLLHLNSRDGSPIPDDLLDGIEAMDSLWLWLHGTRANLTALIGNRSQLRSLHMYECSLAEFVGPVSLPALTRAEFDGTSLSQLGWLTDSPKLSKLVLNRPGPLGDGALLGRITTQELVLSDIKEAELPLPLRQNTDVETLQIRLPEMPTLGDLSAMTGLRHLRIGGNDHNGRNYVVPNLDDVLTLPNLESVRLDLPQDQEEATGAEALACLPHHVFCMVDLFNRGSRGEQLSKQLSIIKNAELTEEQKRRYWRVLLDTPKIKDLPTDDGVLDAPFHMAMLEGKHTPLKSLAHNWLQRTSQASIKARPLDETAVLFICGKSGFKAAELKEKAAELGFTLSKTLSDKVSHVVLGGNPKNTSAIDPNQHLIIDDSALKQWFDAAQPRFLQQSGSEGMVETVLEMLASPDHNSHKVAVSMLEQGGVTEPMLMPLFLALKTTSDKAMRKTIQGLLAGLGSADFQLAVNDRVYFEDDLRGFDWEGHPTGEGPMMKKLKTLPKRWGRPLVIDFAKAYFDRYGEGLLWVLTQKEECPQRRAIINGLVEGETLNWHKGCGMARVLEGADEERLENCHRSPDIYMQHCFDLGSPKTRLPEALPRDTRITELAMHNCYLDSLPANIEHYTDVTRLNLRFNHIETLSPKLAKLTELEELDLSYNHIYEFPKVLMKLKKLKRLDLRRASPPQYRGGYDTDEGYEPLRAPEAFRKAFPQCEILEDE